MGSCLSHKQNAKQVIILQKEVKYLYKKIHRLESNLFNMDKDISYILNKICSTPMNTPPLYSPNSIRSFSY